MIYVYALKFEGCKKSYVGVTEYPTLRFNQHIKSLEKEQHSNDEMQSAFLTFGAPSMVILSRRASNSLRNSEEKKWIEKIGRENLFNKTNGNSDEPSKFQTVKMSDDRYKELSDYCEKNGIVIRWAVDTAIGDWLRSEKSKQKKKP